MTPHVPPAMIGLTKGGHDGVPSSASYSRAHSHAGTNSQGADCQNSVQRGFFLLVTVTNFFCVSIADVVDVQEPTQMLARGMPSCGLQLVPMLLLLFFCSVLS